MQFIGIKISNSIKKLFLGVMVALLLFSNISTALALSNQRGSDPTGKSQRSIIEKTPWLDPTACASPEGIARDNIDTSCRGVFYPIVKDEAAFAAALLKYIKQEKPNSPMATAEIAGFLVAAGKKYNVNPMLLIAMAYQESQLCTDGVRCDPTTNRNPWGNLRRDGTLVPYKSWEASVNGFAQNVGVNHIQRAGKITLELEIPYHCGTKDIFTNTVGKCDGPGYYQKTIDRMNTMIALAGTALSCSVVGDSSPPSNTSALQTAVCAGGVAQSYGDGTCAAIPNNPVQIAINCSWPNRTDGDDNFNPFPGYLALLASVDKNPPYAGRDCGSFVGTVMRASGADPNYPKSGTFNQEPYVRNHPEKYQIIESVSSTAELVPGDILIVNQGGGADAKGHTYIYVGRQANGNDSASASFKKRYPGLGKAVLRDSRGSYMVARLIK